MKKNLLIAVLILTKLGIFSQTVIKGKVLEPDSLTPMPFVYVINKKTGNGGMSNAEGKFTIAVEKEDTLIFSYVGYAKQFIAVSGLKQNSEGECNIIMRNRIIKLPEVTISTFSYKPYEKEHMYRIIEQSKIAPIDAVQSPITAMYMQFSRRGKEIRKLAKIYNEILIEEQVSKKINPEIVRKITGDENIDYEAFRRYCIELSDYYILQHEGYELYNKVNQCYKRYKSEGR